MRSDRTATLPLATVSAAGASDAGRQRDTNEDRFYVDAAQGIFLVVDGVGGEAAGEVAAAIAVETILDRLARQDGPAETRIREAITLANQQILHSAQADAGRKGMACVLTLAVLEGRQLTIGHVGDSRLYKLTPQGIAKLTHDHSPVGEREDARELTETQAMQHARRNEVYRDVGSEWREPDAENFIEIVFTDLPEDSAILLCSDGLSDMLTSLEINRLVRLHAGDPAAAVRGLIAAANEAGGKDNITVVLAEGRTFAQHTPATPIVFSPPEPAPSPAVDAKASRPGETLPADRNGAKNSHEDGVAGQRAPEPSARREAAAQTKKPGPLGRLFGSRGVALVLGALLGVSAALLPGLLEKPAGGRRLVVGGPAGEYPSISAALARADAGDVVLVEPGEYAERLDLPAGVELVSRVPDAAVLVAEPSPVPWVSVSSKGGPGALRGFLIRGRAEGTIYIGVRLQGDGFEIDNTTFDGAIETGVEVKERAGASVLRGNHFNVSGVPVRLGGAISPMLRRNHFFAPADPRVPAIDVGAAATPRLDENFFVRFTQPVAPMRRDLSLQGNVIIPPAARR
jgi:serine/threonine protein phosphatase PrpC